MKFLTVIIRLGDVAINDLPETVYILSMSQNVRVIQPITPAVNAPSLAPLKVKNRENAIERYHNPLRINQLKWKTSGLASSI
jgi:hypothetical protein